jgi:hypothetical protein
MTVRSVRISSGAVLILHLEANRQRQRRDLEAARSGEWLQNLARSVGKLPFIRLEVSPQRGSTLLWQSRFSAQSLARRGVAGLNCYRHPAIVKSAPAA